MNFFKRLWNNPYPELVVGPIVRFFHRIESQRKENILSDKMYRLRCLIISGIVFVILWLLTGQSNPLNFLVDIPITDLEEFSRSVNGNEYIVMTYFLGNALVLIVCLYFIKLFVLNAKEYTLFSVNGFLFYLMSLLVSTLVTIPVREITYDFYIKHGTLIGRIENGETIIGLVIIGIVLNFILYFTLQDSVSAILSSAISIELIILFQKYFQEKTSIEIFYLFAVSIITRFFLEIFEMTGVWKCIGAFFAKWFYTLKNIVKLAFCVITLIFWLYSLSNNKRSDEK